MADHKSHMLCGNQWYYLMHLMALWKCLLIIIVENFAEKFSAMLIIIFVLLYNINCIIY